MSEIMSIYAQSGEASHAAGVLKVFMNHIYEYKKGVRRMILFTFNNRYTKAIIQRIESQHIAYLLQPVGKGERMNLFFGKPECIETIRMMVDKPLNRLTPEEDFILGAMLGYDICAQCERYCERKCKPQDCAVCICLCLTSLGMIM